MNTIHELGQAVRARRTEMDLTQSQVARMSGLSRQTISQVETGAVPDLGLNKVEKLASVLGLAVRVEGIASKRPAQRRLKPLVRAASSASVSYKKALKSGDLKKILVHGRVPSEYEPHLHALLDDASVSLLASVAEQLHQEAGLDRESAWKNFRALARQVKSEREIWK